MREFKMSVLTCTSRRFTQSLYRLVGALLFLTLAGCAQNPVTGESNFVMLSEDSEIAIGRENHPKIIKQYGRYDNEALQTYVQAIGERLANASHRSELIYRFTVLDSPVINAFALPGGYIYITRGLMAYLNSEAELAAVLGHEIGHVTARHGVRQQSAAQAANLGYTLGAILLPQLRNRSSQQLFNVLGGALLSGYGREHELEADALGAEYLARTGYDSRAMIDVIRVLKNQEVFAAEQAKKQGREYKGYHGLFASHPDNDTRLHEVVAKAERYKMGEKKRGSHTYLAQINGMTFGDSEKQGIRSGRNFYHLDLGFAVAFPAKWQINNNPTSLQAIAPDGNAFIQMTTTDINRKTTPQKFVQQRLKIEDLRSGKAFKAHGLSAYTGVVEEDGKVGRISVVFLGQRAYIFFATSKEPQQFQQFDKDFLATAESFHKLRKNEKQLAMGKRIDIVKVSAKDSYAKWAKKSRISNSPEQQLRLLNAHYPQGELVEGQQAKRVK
jgi:predicted Zn-dependent protease